MGTVDVMIIILEYKTLSLVTASCWQYKHNVLQYSTNWICCKGWEVNLDHAQILQQKAFAL